ncbi:MAG: Rieske 2Fe-2S domain-containing protein [Acidobacteria bacterium]|nr:Rieske 2Fe-2S domain-containing protein [Acidobacteriota bacterium]
MVSTTLLYPRRAFLSWCLGVLATGRRLPSMGRRLWSKGHRLPAATGAQTYRDLETPVVLPSKAIADPWSSLPFEAWVPRDDPTGGAAVLAGVLLRTGAKGAPSDPTGSDAAGGVQAFCLLCPHEICHVEYRTDTSQVRLEIGATPEHPLLVCPCHFSVFNPLSGGALISGPAYRGLYRFKVQVEQDTVKITQVEEGVLTLFDTVSLEEEALTLLDAVSPEEKVLTLPDVVSPSREER